MREGPALRTSIVSVLVSLVLGACGSVVQPSVDASSDAADAPHSASDASVTQDASHDDVRGERLLPVDDETDAEADANADANADAADASVREASADDGTPVDAAAPVSDEFQRLYDTLLGPRCGACHTAETTASNLRMPDAVTARANLVNQPVRCRSASRWRDGEIRVTPFAPMRSVFVAPYELCGIRHTASGQSFSLEEQARVEAWILGGAR